MQLIAKPYSWVMGERSFWIRKALGAFEFIVYLHTLRMYLLEGIELRLLFLSVQSTLGWRSLRHHREGCWGVAQSSLTLCDPVDCSPPGSSVHGILQAGVLERAAISSSRGPSQLYVHKGDFTNVLYRIPQVDLSWRTVSSL